MKRPAKSSWDRQFTKLMRTLVPGDTIVVKPPGLQSVGHAIAITAPSTAFQFAIERRADTSFAIFISRPAIACTTGRMSTAFGRKPCWSAILRPCTDPAADAHSHKVSCGITSKTEDRYQGATLHWFRVEAFNLPESPICDVPIRYKGFRRARGAETAKQKAASKLAAIVAMFLSKRT